MPSALRRWSGGGGDSPGLFIHLFLFWMLLCKLSHLSIFANWSCVVKKAPQPYQSSLPCSYLCEAVPFWPVVWSHSVSLYTDFQCLCGLLAALYVVLSCHYRCCKWQLLTLIATSHRATNKHYLPNVRLPEGTILLSPRSVVLFVANEVRALKAVRRLSRKHVPCSYTVDTCWFLCLTVGFLKQKANHYPQWKIGYHSWLQ